MLLAGDIGGTKTLLGLYEAARGAREPVAQAEFASADYPNLEEIVQTVSGASQEEGGVCLFWIGRADNSGAGQAYQSALVAERRFTGQKSRAEKSCASERSQGHSPCGAPFAGG